MRITVPLCVLSLTSLAVAQWNQAYPTTSPAHRIEPSMAFDAIANKTVMFGGADTSSFQGVYFDETWTFDGSDWTLEAPLNSPPGRFFGGMCYDAVRGVMVFYGGETSSFIGPNYFDDTWEWDGVNWTQISTATTPGGILQNSGLAEHSMAYDVLGQRTVLFGGELFGGFVPAPATTIEYDGVDWVQVTAAVQPPRRSQAAMCTATSLGGVLMFGGTNFNNPGGPNGEITWNDLWLYRSTNNPVMPGTWTELTPATGPMPMERAGASLLFDSNKGVYVMHGGYESTPTGLVPMSDTWEFDGTSWTDVTASYGAPAGPRIRFDSAEGPNGCHVLFGGSDGQFPPITFSDTWVQGECALAGVYGAGCAGSFGTPTLAPTSLPVLGSSFDLDAMNLDPAGGVAFLAIGWSNTNSLLGPLPLDLQAYGFGSGCELLSSAEFSTLFPIPGGMGTYSLSLPSAMVLIGLDLYFQVGSVDAAATGGFAFSNGVAATIGN